jgi:hypothetical protein
MNRIGVALITILVLTVATPRAAAAADLVATYPVGSQPFGIVSDQSDGRLYVANSGTRTASGGGRVSVIDPATNAVGSLDTTKPSGLLALDSAARRLYSSNYDATNNSVSLDVLDLSSGGLVMSTQVGGLGVALDTTRSRVFVSGGNYFVAMNTVTFDMDVRAVPFGETWFGVATDPALGRVYVTSSRPSLVVLDATSLSTIAVISLPSSPRYAVAVDEVSHLVYVAGNDVSGPPFAASALSVMDSGTFALTTVTMPGFPGGLAHSSAAHRLWITDSFGNALTAVDDVTLAVVAGPIALPWSPSLAAFGRDGRLYVSGQSASVVGAFTVADKPANSAPVIDRVAVSPLSPATNEVLTSTVDAHDPDGDAFTLTYAWSVNGAVRASETGATLDLSKAGNGDRGDTICLAVTASDGTDETTVSSCFVHVRDSAPVAAVALDSVTPSTDATLRATATASDIDGDPLQYTFRWLVGGVEKRAITGATSTDTFDLSVAGNGDGGDVVTVEVVASDGTLLSASASASATVANTSPTVAVWLSDSTANKHDLLVATAYGRDGDGDALTFTYVWRVDGVVKQTTSGTSATTNELDLRDAGTHIGDVITVTVIASDGSATATATASATVTPAGH